MRKRTRMLIVALVLALLAMFLVPSFEWYISWDKQKRTEATYTIAEIKSQSREFAERGYALFEEFFKKNPDGALDLLKSDDMADLSDNELAFRKELYRALKKEVVSQYKMADKSIDGDITFNHVKGIFFVIDTKKELKELDYRTQQRMEEYLIDYKRQYFFDLKERTKKIIQLGLDLNGGISYTLQADLDDYVKSKNSQNIKSSYEQAIKDGKIIEENADLKEISKIQDLLDDKNIEYSKIALSDSGLVHHVMEIAIEQVTERVNIYGASEPDIRQLGQDLIQVDLPGAKDPQRLERLLMGSGSLNFHVADNKLTEVVNQWVEANADDPRLVAAKEKFKLTQKLVLPEEVGVPADYMVVGSYKKDAYQEDELESYMVVQRAIGMAGAHIVQASVPSLSDSNSKVATAFQLDSQGASIFSRLTSDATKESPVWIAVLMDGRVKMSAAASKKLQQTNLIVEGSGIGVDEAKDFAKLLNLGSKDVRVSILSTNIVGASLGEDNIGDGVFALAIAMALVVGFMLLWYLGGGLAAVIALVMNIFIMAGILSQVKLTLTLPGLAGLILTVGMSVDANVIIFERIKEEARLGKSAVSALRSGFQKAFWTILDANLTTFIAAVVLSWFGSGTVKGFAIILAVGIFSSMFTALFVVRLFLDIGVETFKSKRLLISWRK